MSHLKLALLLSTLSLAACEDPVECTGLAVAAVNVTVLDDGGLEVPEVAVTFAVDGAAAESCEDMGGGSFACAFEQVGSIVVHAEAQGFNSDEETVVVVLDADGCHSVAQSVALTLSAMLD